MFRILAVLPLLAACGLRPIDAPDPDRLDPIERARFELGRDLFFDEGLSGAGDISCGTCHQPEYFGAEPLPTSIGTGGAEVPRNSPSVFNAALKRFQFWDGRAETLEEQAEGPLFAENEMGATRKGLVAYVSDEYDFSDAFPDEEGPTVDQVTRALAAYQRMLPSPSRFDRYLQGERDALTDKEREGLRLFRGNCAFCHTGDGVGGDRLRTLGDEIPWPIKTDLGRFEVTGDPADKMVFAVPSLRNVAQTAPYFHDGSVETLEEAVELMSRHQLGQTMPKSEVDAIVAFLGALDAETIPEWAFPRDSSTE